VANLVTIPPIDLVKISIEWPAQQESNLHLVYYSITASLLLITPKKYIHNTKGIKKIPLKVGIIDSL